MFFICIVYVVIGGSVYVWLCEKRKVFLKYKCDVYYVLCFNFVLWNVYGVDLNWYFCNKYWFKKIII